MPRETETTKAAGREAAAVVVIEDDPNIADLVGLYLGEAGYRPYLAADGEAGLAAVERHRPKLVVLDVGLPGGLDGFEVCRRLRATSDVPVMLLTARGDEIDRVVGFELGADDYVTKPFSPRELVARVRAILRRADGPAPATDVTVLGALEVDPGRREARVDGAPVGLATRELDLLLFLTANRGLALSRRQLLDGVWGADWYGDERTVDVHVRQLRRKLGEALPLATVWGHGYRLD
ncbi:MAG: response regulator transcription factor [Acidimicrobiia bacterium]